MAAESVDLFRKSRGATNDRNDAQTIVTAMRDPNMRFAAIRSAEQQSIRAWHRMRSGYQQERTALINRVRGPLAEFGIWIGRSSGVLTCSLPGLVKIDALPPHFRPLLPQAYEQPKQLDQCIEVCEKDIERHPRQSAAAQRVCALAGTNPTTASALIATFAYPAEFRNSRQMAAWLGLVPASRASGASSSSGSSPNEAIPIYVACSRQAPDPLGDRP